MRYLSKSSFRNAISHPLKHRKPLRFILLPLVLCALVLVTFQQPFVPAAQAQTWNLVWSDEFNGTSVDSSNWTFETGGGGWGNNELEYYTNGQNASVSGGALTITASAGSGGFSCWYGTCQYTSTRMNTKGKRQFQYGRIEARMQLPMGQGLWPAFWSLGANFPGTPWPASGEIDFMEHINSEGNTHGYIHWDSGGHASYGSASPAINPAAWNTYMVEWTPSYIRWHVNGVQFVEANILNNINSTEEFHRPFFIILNLAVGGAWPGNPNTSTVFPARLLVDYVRVYQQGVTPPTNTPLSPTRTSTRTNTPVTPPPGNLAVNKPATASGSCNTNEGPNKAVNGSVSGGNTDKWCHSTTAAKWLQVDLAATYNITQFIVRHAGAGGESTSFNTNAFNIQTSTDNVNWTTRVTVSGNTANVTTHNIAAASGRYVRLNITNSGADSAARIYEFEVYGSGGTAPTNTPVSPTRTNTPSGSTTWAPNTAYSVGALVTYNGSTYRCLQAHTSQVGWEPPNAPSLWQLQSGTVPTNTPVGPTSTRTNTPVSPTRTNTPTSGNGSPYGGTAPNLPGTIQAENYNTGGEGIAFHDLEVANQGGQYRTTEGVDIEASTDTGGGFNVGWTQAGEWAKYTVNVTASGTYSINFRVASAVATGSFNVEVDGVNVTGTMTTPNTGGWQTWTTLTRTGVNLTAGQHVLRLVITGNDTNINWISVTSGGTAPTATRVPATTVPPASFWGDTTGIPAASNVLMVKFLNRTNGRWTDSQIFWNFNGVTRSIAEQPYFDMPANSAGRMNFYLESPTSQYTDFIEFTVGPDVFNGNTTRVDWFGIKLALRLHAHDGYDVQVGEDQATFTEDRAVTFQKFINEVPAEFDHLAQLWAPYRIPAPGKMGDTRFTPTGQYANYFTSYAQSVGVSANVFDIMACAGSLANNAAMCSALNRHVAHLAQSSWSNVSLFYQAAPANYYAKFWHDHSINKLAYGFPYDDYAEQSSFISHGDPQWLIVAIGW